jgi:hypothetical protein
VEPTAPVRSAPPPADDKSLIRGVVALYARALNEKNISLLTQIRPNLPRSEAEALLKGMEATKLMSFRDLDVRVDENRASVRLTRHDVVGEDNTQLQAVLMMTLVKQGDSWVIERIVRAR